jgi:sugar lactone lactonase YvrE
MLFTTLLLASSAISVLADAPSGEVVVASEEEVEKLPDAGDVAEGLREVKERAAEEQQLRETPQAEEEREISTDAYADLTASQAESLLQEQFAEQLAVIDQDPARALSDARLDEVLGPSAALVTLGGDTMLLEGTIPVQATDEEGDLSKVDLDLEQDAAGYVPQNPITEVTLPANSSEPVSMGGEGFAISPVLTEPVSSARPLEGEDVQYFETQKDSDLIVSPLAAGVEVFSLLRSAESPEELRFEITVPAGAELRADGEGGAEVVREDARLIRIPAPLAFDAQGADVPVAMQVDGSSLVLTVEHRGQDMAYPLLVDPQAVNENWYENGNDWYHYGNLWALEPGTSPWVWGTNNGGRFWAGTTPIYSAPGLSNRGLFISATSLGSSQPANQYGQFTITAPGTDSYFSAALINPFWRWDHGCGYGTYPEPHDYSGLWNDYWGWATFHSNWARVYGYGIETPFEQLKGTPDEWRAPTGHVLVIGMGTGNGAGAIPCWRDLYAGGVMLWMDDWDQPVLTTSPSYQWMDNVPVRLNVSASDVGLGVRKFEAEATDKSGATRKWETWHSCTGGFKAKCPQGWNLGDSSQPKLSYDPSVLPEGVRTLYVTAYDAVLRKSNITKEMAIRVDHAAPTITLSGTLTEQATLGTERPKYTIRADAKDGVPGSNNPEEARAGVASLIVKNDGQIIGQKSPGCSTQSCAGFLELEVPASELTPGFHTLSVTATDALGHVATKQLSYATGDKQAPSLSTSALLSGPSVNPAGATYWSAFGTSGAGNGQLNRPADVAVGPNGEVWVADRNNNRIQKFDAEGKFQFKFGTKGSGDGQLSAPTALAVDAQGNLWVADSGNRRVQKFNAKGEYLAKFGSQGTGNGQFSGYGPRGIAIDAQGNLWVSDYSTRIQKFNANGEFLKVVGAGQFGESAALDAGGGKIWVGDWASHQVSVFSEAGDFLFKFGSAGSGNGQFNHADAVEVDAQGNVWIGDEGNSRVQQFNQAGEYATQFGSNGTGKGQFKFAWPIGLTSDDKGSLWIADSENHRIQRWVAPTTTASGYLEPITATATDGGFGVTSVAIKLTNKALNTEVLDEATQTCAQGACQLSLNADELDLSEHPAGPYVLSVVAKDGAGNVRETSLAFNLDGAPPEIELAGELVEGAGAPLATASAELEIEATEADPASGGVKTIRVERNGQLVASYPSDCSSDCHEVEASYTFQAKEDGAERSIRPVASAADNSVGELKRVSCVTADDCWAVGRTKYTTAEQMEGKVAAPLLERWNGSTWQAVTVPKPEGATNVFLEGVSCNSASACLAVGYYSTTSGNYPLAERWNGTKWTPSSPPLPSGSTKGYLYGVSCSSTSDCWAYGKTQVTTAEQMEGKVAVAFLDRWNGSTWQAMAVPKTPSGSEATLAGIACISGSACTAVGRYNSGYSETLPLAFTWNGSEWRFQPVPTPTEATTTSLEGVSCIAANECVSVGYSRVGSGKWTVLAETEAPGEGSHQITVEAVDVQGNSDSKTIEIDVDPTSEIPPECNTEPELEPAQGILTPGQAIDAVEEALPAAIAPTDGATAPSTEEVIDPSYSPPSPNLETVDSLASGETSVTPEGGFTLGDSVCISPTTLTPAASDATVVNGDAALFANTGPETDTVIRPTAMGTTVIQSLRGPKAADTLAWNVKLSAGQDLVELPSGDVAVVQIGSEGGEVSQVPSPPEKLASYLADVEAQVENGEYALINAQDESQLEVVAVIAKPWVVLASGWIVPALLEVVEGEIPNEFEMIIHAPLTEEEEAVWPAQVITDAASASAVNGGGCSKSESPCGGLDLNRMAKYAVYWGSEAHHFARNPFYADYGSNNCTNFISQILRAGGGKFMRAYEHGDGSWWYYNFSKGGGVFGPGPSAGWDDTESWKLADVLPRHLWRFELAYIDSVQQPHGWMKGNIIALDWIDSDGKGNVNHLNFVVGTQDMASGREPMIANSSSQGANYSNLLWRDVKNRVEGLHGSQWGRFSLAARHRVANLKAKKHDPANLYGPNGLFRG